MKSSCAFRCIWDTSLNHGFSVSPLFWLRDGTSNCKYNFPFVTHRKTWAALIFQWSQCPDLVTRSPLSRTSPRTQAGLGNKQKTIAKDEKSLTFLQRAKSTWAVRAQGSMAWWQELSSGDCLDVRPGSALTHWSPLAFCFLIFKLKKILGVTGWGCCEVKMSQLRPSD